jgi:selenocysteine lyase/cysteine desulfurase
VARCRRRVLSFFNADPEEYVLIFTSNASAALKLVGESYPFGEADRFLLTYDNHNSVVGIRAFDRVRRAQTRYVPVEPPNMRVPTASLFRALEDAPEARNKLFAYPAQSNFSGVQHPLEWIQEARALGWDVLLDAAAYVPTSRLDLSRWRPDYLTLSFYKMFGYPTGVGALIARRKALRKLHRPWFAGGTITWASVLAESHSLSPGSEGFEDGTLNYTSLPAVEMGLDFLEDVGMEVLSRRVKALTGWLIRELTALRHSGGEPLVRVYGPLDTEVRGGTVALNVYDARGRHVDHRTVEEEANAWGISLRTGCFCNPGAGEMALGLERGEILTCLHRSGDRMTLDEFRQCIDGKSTGAVRISFGVASNFADALTVREFFRGFLNR